MPDDLGDALAALRPLLLDEKTLVRAVAAGRRRAARPRWERVELRPVDLKSGRRLQIVTHGGGAPLTRNEDYGAGAEQAVDDLLADSFGNWHVQTTTETLQLRVTKKGAAQLHRAPNVDAQHTGHDREKPHLIDPGDPLFKVLGAGASKRRQVDAFLRVLAGAVDDADLPTDRPLRVVDLGCGNAYLTFAAQRFLTSVRGLPVRLTGVDVREKSRDHNNDIAATLGVDAVFVVGSIEGAQLDPAPEVVLALHACDTATDEALARAVGWGAQLVLAAPCCHHDVAAQLRRTPTPAPYAMLTRHGILRERLADTLTDGLRASLMRLQGYRVDVMQFVESRHTPRNTMLRAVLTAPVKGDEVRTEYDTLVADWGIRPRLAELLGLVEPGP
jgi:SAM-dependent methyltransferase